MAFLTLFNANNTKTFKGNTLFEVPSIELANVNILKTKFMVNCRHYINPSPGNGFLRRSPTTGVKLPPGISRVLEHSDKVPTATPVFGIKRSSGGTSGFVGRRCVLEIPNGSQITGSSNNFAVFTDTHVVPKPILIATTIVYQKL